ncbi:MAG: hypothetical protein IJR61_04570, partial [Clostridia bacterium]|nr:hypothetical protein [Clostridia bacterium]
GTRANFSALGERAKIDVKNFTTTISADTPIGIATVISLQTAETGTIGGGNGNGMHVLLRKDGETTLTLAVYNQNASRTYFARENALEIANDKTVRIEFDYDGGAINVASGNSSVTVENLKEGFDEHYSQYDYKGYYTLSCYYMAAVKSNACVYTVKEINGKTPAEVDGEVVSAALADLKAAVDALGESSSYEDIESAAALDVFTEGVWGEVASAVANAAFITQKREVDEKLSIFIGKLEYGRKTDAIAEFAEALEGYSSKSAEEKKSVKAAYEKIFSLSEEHTTVE